MTRLKIFLMVFTACAASVARGSTQESSSVRALYTLGEEADAQGNFSQELRLSAAQDETLIAWLDGQGALRTLSAYDLSGNELARDEPGLSARPARIEVSMHAGETCVILCEASDIQPWAWARMGAGLAHESELTRGAANVASKALRLAQEYEAADDHEAQRAVLAGAISELSSLPAAMQSRALADALWSLVFPACSAGELEAALAAAAVAAQVRARFEPHASRSVLQARIGVANVLNDMGRFAEAALVNAELEAYYARTLSADDTQLALVRFNWVNCLRQTGELGRPARLAAAAMAVYECRLPPESSERQRGESIVAELDMALGRSEESARRYRDLYRRALESKDAESIQDAARNYAIALSQTGELEFARQLEEDCLARAERRLPSDHPGLIKLRENLAATLIELGDMPRAHELLLAALAPFERDADMDRFGAMYVLCNLGELERRRGDFVAARAYFDRALEIGERCEDPNDAVMPLNGLAQTLLAQGEPEQAQKLLERLVAMRLATGDENRQYAISAQLALAECLRTQGKWKPSIELGLRVLQALSASLPADDSRVFEARLLILLTRHGAGLNDSTAANLEAWMRDAARVLARASLAASPRAVEERAYSWRTLVDAALSLSLAVEQNSSLSDACSSLLETRRASSLWAADALRLAGESRAAQDARAELAQLSRQLAREGAAEHSVEGSIGRITAAKDKAEQLLIAGLLRGASTIPWGEPVDPSRLRAGLGPRDAAVSFANLADGSGAHAAAAHLVAVVLRREGSTQLVDLGPASRVDEAVLAWRKALGTEGNPAASAQEERSTGEHLRNLAFDPLRRLLEGVERIFVVPDGSLHLIALDALPDANGVLGDHFSLRIVPALSVLAPSLERRPPAQKVVLIGGLDYGAGSLAGLVGSGEEVASLYAIYRGSKREVELLVGRSVDRQRFADELAHAGILHIATHGDMGQSVARAQALESTPSGPTVWSALQSVRELSPLALCGLALSGANEPAPDGERAGFVRGVELASLDASRCELVVLSACETRVGVVRPGLSVASLEKAMHMAGARAVLASLWKVDDAQSRELMVEFHRGMVEHSLAPADALWRAKLQLRSRRLPVRAWAGWVLSSVDVRASG